MRVCRGEGLRSCSSPYVPRPYVWSSLPLNCCIHVNLPHSTLFPHRNVTQTIEVSDETPVLVDKYLDRATALDVDALCDKDGNVVICGVMEHIEQAGIHSGRCAALTCSHCVWIGGP